MSYPQSADDCVHAFRDALVALAPIASRIGVAWKEPDNYNDWDAIAASIFDAFVLSAAANAHGAPDTFKPFVRYDSRVRTYETLSYVAVLHPTAGPAALVCLETAREPFDTCLYAKTTGEGTAAIQLGRLPVEECHWQFCYRSEPDVHSTVEVRGLR